MPSWTERDDKNYGLSIQLATTAFQLLPFWEDNETEILKLPPNLRNIIIGPTTLYIYKDGSTIILNWWPQWTCNQPKQQAARWRQFAVKF